MTKSEFAAGMRLITEIYGEKKYPAVLMMRLFEELQPMEGSRFFTLMRDLTFTARLAPTPAEIRSACGSALTDARRRIQAEAIRKLEARATRCPHCSLSGWIFAFKIEPKEQDPKHVHYGHSGYEFGFQCPYCDAAKIRKLHHDIPKWSAERHGPDFVLRDFGSSKQKASNARIQNVLSEIAAAHGISHFGPDEIGRDGI